MTKQLIKLHAGWLTTMFAAGIILLACAHLVMQSIKYHLGLAEVYGLVRQFVRYFSREVGAVALEVVRSPSVLLASRAVGEERRRRWPVTEYPQDSHLT